MKRVQHIALTTILFLAVLLHCTQVCSATGYSHLRAHEFAAPHADAAPSARNYKSDKVQV